MSALLLAVLAVSAQAQDVCATCTHTSLGAAIAAATSGDTITVGAGTYTETLDITIDLTFTAVDGRDQTTVDTTSGQTMVNVDNNAAVTWSGFTFTSANNARCLRVRNDSRLTLVDSRVTNCTAFNGSDGAGVLAESNSALVVRNSIFVDNTVTGNGRGGHISADGASLIVRGSGFSGGSGQDRGAGINVARGSATIEGSTFTSNSTPGDDGGAIYIAGGADPVVLADTVFSTNTADRGGALYVDGPAAAWTLDHLTFLGNSARQGGALHWTPPNGSVPMTVLDTRFASNSATAEGGAMFVQNAGPVDLIESTFEANDADVGGAVYLTGLNALVSTRSFFCANTATGRGGAAYLDNVGGVHRWENNGFQENASGDDGGGLYVTGAPPSFFFNVFIGNDGFDRGGGMRVDGPNVTFRNNVVTETVSGSGLYVNGGTADLDYNAWFRNTAAHLAGDLTDADVGPNSVVDTNPRLSGYVEGTCDLGNLIPSVTSPLTDAGDPTLLDADGTAADIGLCGGPESFCTGQADADTDADSDADTDTDTDADSDADADQPKPDRFGNYREGDWAGSGVCSCATPGGAAGWLLVLPLMLAIRRR